MCVRDEVICHHPQTNNLSLPAAAELKSNNKFRRVCQGWNMSAPETRELFSLTIKLLIILVSQSPKWRLQIASFVLLTDLNQKTLHSLSQQRISNKRSHCSHQALDLVACKIQNCWWLLFSQSTFWLANQLLQLYWLRWIKFYGLNPFCFLFTSTWLKMRYVRIPLCRTYTEILRTAPLK